MIILLFAFFIIQSSFSNKPEGGMFKIIFMWPILPGFFHLSPYNVVSKQETLRFRWPAGPEKGMS